MGGEEGLLVEAALVERLLVELLLVEVLLVELLLVELLLVEVLLVEVQACRNSGKVSLRLVCTARPTIAMSRFSGVAPASGRCAATMTW